jgi:hypothetical protein
MRRKPHPLLNVKDKNGNPVLRNHIRDISDDEFERIIQMLEPHEREFAIKYRKRYKHS